MAMCILVLIEAEEMSTISTRSGRIAYAIIWNPLAAIEIVVSASALCFLLPFSM